MNKRGQSMIEYVLIAVLVILGVVIMGPYVLRSVGAHFQLWDYSTQDSFDENIVQSNTIPIINSNCTCSSYPTTGQCGSPCGPNQEAYTHTCTPAGCDGEPGSFCQNDPSCCTGLNDLGCGTIPCPPTGCAGAPLTVQHNNCYFGQMLQGPQFDCSNPEACVYDASCNPQCLGIVQNNTSPCPGSPGTGNGAPALLQNEGVNYVQNETNQGNGQTYCTTGTACQYYCGANQVLLDGVCTAQCATHTFSSSQPNYGCSGGACCGTIIGDNSPGLACPIGGYGGPDSDTIVEAAYVCTSHGYNYMLSYSTASSGDCNGCNYIDIGLGNNSPVSIQDIQNHQNLTGIIYYPRRPPFNHWNGASLIRTVKCSNCPQN